jgi:REP element-mobilizing transposase RayT
MDDRQIFHSSALRRGRYSSPGQIYHITITTSERKPHFTDLYVARAVVQALRQSQQMGDSLTLAYVLMPDHLHWLMELAERRSLSAVVGAVKSVSAHRIGHPLWQPGFHDHALRKEEDVVHIARYIVANPLRAGLVTRLGDYPHWDAVWL